jgi:hypothetical protein
MITLIALLSVAAGTTTGTISGRVTNDLDSTAVAGAIVRLWEQHASDSTLTDSFGYYNLKLKLTPGRHTLRTSYRDYVPITRAFTLDSGRHVRIDFQIHPKPFEMPAVTIEDRKQWWYDSLHNDSVLRLLRGLRCVTTKPWLKGHSLVPDSAAIRFNNEAMATAVHAFLRRTGSLFRLPSSYCLHGDNSYLIVNRGKCRLIGIPEYPKRRYRLYDVDSLRLSVDSLGLRAMPPGTQLQYVPSRLEAFVRDRWWAPVVIQHVEFRL